MQTHRIYVVLVGPKEKWNLRNKSCISGGSMGLFVFVSGAEGTAQSKKYYSYLTIPASAPCARTEHYVIFE